MPPAPRGEILNDFGHDAGHYWPPDPYADAAHVSLWRCLSGHLGHAERPPMIRVAILLIVCGVKSRVSNCVHASFDSTEGIPDYVVVWDSYVAFFHSALRVDRHRFFIGQAELDTFHL